jgi:hypothetical protein
MAEPQFEEERSPPRYEPGDVPAFLPLWLALCLGGFVVLVLIAISVAFPLADRQQYRGPLQPLPPRPQLQMAPGRDFERYRAARRGELETYGRVDAAHARVPIELAMRLTASEGWGKA